MRPLPCLDNWEREQLGPSLHTRFYSHMFAFPLILPRHLNTEALTSVLYICASNPIRRAETEPTSAECTLWSAPFCYPVFLIG